MFNYKSLLAEPNFKPHWNEEIKTADYHANKDAVNSSSLKKMIKSPLAFHQAYYGEKTEPSEAMKFGTLAHLALLQGSVFKEKYVVMPEFESRTADGKISESKNTKFYKDQVADWKSKVAVDAVVVTQEEQDKLFGMIQSIQNHKMAVKLLSKGKPEVCGFWVDPETGIKCRMQADFIAFDLGALVDVKTTSDCSENTFKRTIENYDYAFQLVMYSEGIKHITGQKPKHMAWIAIENVAPFEVKVFEMSPQYEEIGLYQYRMALRKLRECIDSGKFEQAQKEIEIIEPNGWYLKQYENKLI